MNKLTTTGASVDSWGTMPATGHQLDSVPLISTLRPTIHVVLNLPYHPLIHPTLPTLVYEDIMGDSIKALLEVQVENIHCSPLIYTATCPIIEGNQVGQE